MQGDGLAEPVKGWEGGLTGPNLPTVISGSSAGSYIVFYCMCKCNVCLISQCKIDATAIPGRYKADIEQLSLGKDWEKLKSSSQNNKITLICIFQIIMLMTDCVWDYNFQLEVSCLCRDFLFSNNSGMNIK